MVALVLPSVALAQPLTLGWQNNKLSFLESQPVPVQIAKLLQEKPPATGEPTWISGDGRTVATREQPSGNALYYATITLRTGEVSRVVRNPRADARWKPYKGRKELVFDITPETMLVSSMVFSPDGKTLFAGSNGGGIRVIDVATGEETGLVTAPEINNPWRLAHRGAVTGLWTITDPESAGHWWLVSAARDATVKIWDGQTRALLTRAGYDSAVEAVWTRDGSQLLLAADNVVFRVAPLRSNPIQKLNGLSGRITALAVADNQLWARSRDGAVMSWDLETGMSGSFSSPILMAAVSRDRQRIALKFGDGQIRLLRMADTALVSSLTFPRDVRNLPAIRTRLFLNPSGRYLALSALYKGRMTIETVYGETVQVWDMTTKRTRFQGSFQGSSLEWLRVNTLAGTGFIDGSASFIDLEQPNLALRRPRHDAASNIRLKQDKPVLVIANLIEVEGNHITLDLASPVTGAVLRRIGTMPVPKRSALRLTLSPDAKTLAVVTLSSVALWDVERGRLRATKAHYWTFMNNAGRADEWLGFSDDGKSLLWWNKFNASGQVWNAATLEREGNANCKREVLGFYSAPRGVYCNNGSELEFIPFPRR